MVATGLPERVPEGQPELRGAVELEAELAGRVTSGGYGYSVERSIAYAYLPVERGPGTEVAIEIFGEWVGGTVAEEPLYDPRGERIRS